MNKFTVGTKIWTLLLFILIVMGFMGIANNRMIISLTDDIKHEATVLIPAVRLAGNIDMAHDGLRAVVLRSIYLPQDHENNKKELDEKAGALRKSIEELEALHMIPEVFEAIDAAKPYVVSYLKSAQSVLASVTSGDREKIMASYVEFEKTFEALAEKLDKLSDNIISSGDAIAKDDVARAEFGSRILTWMLIATFLISILLAYLVIRVTVNGLRSSTDALIAESKTLREIGLGLDVSSTKLSEATTEQAAAIEETVSSMEEMTAMLSQTTQQSVSSLEISAQGRRDAEDGIEVSNRMITAMSEIQESNKQLERLVSLIREIETKTTVINDIVFETRLLSFNASIEAARAGVHGKGFAVVAEEVGKLAAMSGKAADEIRQLLESSTREVSSVVESVNARVAAGQSVSQECGEAFRGMEATLKKINESVTSIAEAAKEQQLGVEQTNKAMNEMDKSTQANFASMEALASNAKNLSDVIGRVEEATQGVIAMVGVSSHAAAPKKRLTLTPKMNSGLDTLSSKPQRSQPAPKIEPQATRADDKAVPQIEDHPGRSDPRWSA